MEKIMDLISGILDSVFGILGSLPIIGDLLDFGDILG